MTSQHTLPDLPPEQPASANSRHLLYLPHYQHLRTPRRTSPPSKKQDTAHSDRTSTSTVTFWGSRARRFFSLSSSESTSPSKPGGSPMEYDESRHTWHVTGTNRGNIPSPRAATHGGEPEKGVLPMYGHHHSDKNKETQTQKRTRTPWLARVTAIWGSGSTLLLSNGTTNADVLLCSY